VITVAGEALIDLVEEGRGRYRAHPGGSPANVAVGLARLGVPCSMLARISGDALGDQLAAHLAGNGVSLRDVRRVPEPTTLALASLDGAGQAAYSFYVRGTADWQWSRGELPEALPPDVRALHAGSLALALPPGARALEDLLAAERARGRVTISIDPNIRPALAASRAEERTRVERQIRLAHIVKASEEDTGWLYPGVATEAVARDWQQLGPRLVVITLGDRGAYVLAPDGTEVRRPARPVQVVDTVGAGDAFCAGLLDALWRAGQLGAAGERGTGKPLTGAGLAEILDWAVLVAALTCERPGADPPTADEARRASAEASAADPGGPPVTG
jgi:fructokinase